MSVKDVNDDQFENDVLGNTATPTLVDFWAEWCGPCRMVAPVIESIAEKYAGKLEVRKLDTDANPKTSQNYQITGIPCSILFKEGQEIARIVGYRSEDAFTEELSKYLD